MYTTFSLSPHIPKHNVSPFKDFWLHKQGVYAVAWLWRQKKSAHGQMIQLDQVV